VFGRKRRIALSGRVPNIREVRRGYRGQWPAARGQWCIRSDSSHDRIAPVVNIVGLSRWLRSEDQRPEKEEVIRLLGWFFDYTRTARAEAGWNRICVICSHGCQSVKSLVSGVVKRSSCQSIMLGQEELAFIKANSTLQLSPAPRMTLSWRKKEPVVPDGSCSTTSCGGWGAGPPNDHPASLRASAKPTR